VVLIIGGLRKNGARNFKRQPVDHTTFNQNHRAGGVYYTRPSLPIAIKYEYEPVGIRINPNSLWWVHMGISLKERQITEEPMKVKIWKKLLIHNSNGNASETKANESFDNGVFFDIEAKRTLSKVSKLFSKRSEHIR
jgi:hypothetical protein